MKKFRCLLLTLALFANFTMLANTYYVNSETGKNSNKGTSESKPWKDLSRVNSHRFKPGDRILFASGTSYFGTLEPKGSGSAENPIRIDKYGRGEKPAIHGTGWKDFTLLLHNVEYWEIRNLEITNQGPQRKARRRGVIIRAEDFGDCHHIVLEGLEIHHDPRKNKSTLFEYVTGHLAPTIDRGLL